MDQWIQKLSLALLLVIAGLCLYGSVNRVVACNTPAHFTNDHSTYAHQACSKPDSRTYRLEDNPILERLAPENLTLWTSHIDIKSSWLLELVIVELIVICTAYSLIDWLVTAGCSDARSPHKELHQTYFKIPLYFLIQIVCGICWAVFAAKSKQENVFPKGQAVFFCDFTVRRMGNVQSYTFQCIDDHDHFTRAAYIINTGLALVVTITKFIHIVAVLLIGPSLGLKAARNTLLQAGVIKNPDQLGIGFAVSDLYFAMAASGKSHGCPVQGPDTSDAGKGKETELAHLVNYD